MPPFLMKLMRNLISLSQLIGRIDLLPKETIDRPLLINRLNSRRIELTSLLSSPTKRIWSR